MSAVVAAPIAKSILEDAIVALDISRSNGGIDKEYRYYDIKYATVEDVVGLTAKEAREKLKDFDVEYSGNGDVVIAMSPVAGSRIAVGSTVRLMLENK